MRLGHFLPVAAMLVALVMGILVAADGETKPAATQPASDNKAKERDIRILLHISGSGKLGMQVLNSMFDNYKKSYPSVEEEFWTALKKEFDANGFVEILVPIYARHFTHEDITGLIAFYRTPLGRKLVAVQPKLTAEAMTAGAEWGKNVALRALKKIRERRKQGGEDF